MSARRLRVSLRFALCAGALLVLTSAGCGGLKQSSVPPSLGYGGQASAEVSLDKALAELEGMECPEGVDEALWVELKDALGEALNDPCRAAIYGRRATTRNDDGGDESPPYSDSSVDGEGHGMPCPYKWASTPPTGEANRVDDLTIADNGGGTYTLSWHYRNCGDYDQDGAVGIEDITPLAQHFGEDAALENEWIDGDLDGRVHISDITPIAMYCGVEVADYGVEGAASVEGEYAEIGAVGIASATGKDTGRAVFKYALTPGENGYFRVLPRDSDGTPGEASNVVGLALEVLSVSPLEVKEGTVVTFTAEVTGAGPIDYEWDFGGQAVPATSTEPEPEVVLTREVGEFSASLTVTNPQGDVTFPFTLSKLAREWKFETILSNPEGCRGYWLQEYDGELWFSLYDADDPANRYAVHGTPENWSLEETPGSGILSLDSQGRPAFANESGPFLDKTLTLWEKREEEWKTTELTSCRAFSRINFAYATNDEPFITFSLPDAPDSRLIEYFWRKGDVWSRGIIDEHDYPERNVTGMATDPEGNPVLCYNAVESGVGEFRVAWWRAGAEQWDIIVAADYGVWFPAVHFDQADRLCVAYSGTYESEPDVYYDQLIYAVYDGQVWEKYVVDERLSYGDQSYYAKSLGHDPLGNAVIAYSHRKGPETGYDQDTIVEWFDGFEWRDYVLDENAGSSFKTPYILIASDGIGYVLMSNDIRKEVVLARYE